MGLSGRSAGSFRTDAVPADRVPAGCQLNPSDDAFVSRAAWPMWAAPVWIICQVVAGQLTGPWEALAISTACYLGLGLAAVVMAGDQRRAGEDDRRSCPGRLRRPGVSRNRPQIEGPRGPPHRRPIPACRMVGCRLLSTSSSGGVCTTRWRRIAPPPPSPSGASQERVLQRQPAFGECAECERLGIAQPDSAADGILNAHKQIPQLMQFARVLGLVAVGDVVALDLAARRPTGRRPSRSSRSSLPCPGESPCCRPR